VHKDGLRSFGIIASVPKVSIEVFDIIHSFIHSFIHLAVCLTTGPKPLPKRALYIVRSRAFSFGCEYPLISLRSSDSFLRLLPRLLSLLSLLLSFLQYLLQKAVSKKNVTYTVSLPFTYFMQGILLLLESK
jgi:hypothetical protein